MRRRDTNGLHGTAPLLALPGEGAVEGQRDPIRLSWMRSRMAAAPLDRIDIPYREDDGSAERLVRSASPILDRFAEQLIDTNVSLVLADRNARVVGRWAGGHSALSRLSKVSIEEGFVLSEDLAGTNGIGTVLEEMAPVTIFGAEHYSAPLQQLVCVGVPIRHPLSRRMEGVLDLSCPIDEASTLMMPTLVDLSFQIERELLAHSSQREQVVFNEFLARSRGASVPLVGLAEQFMVTNAPAADLLESRDQRLLWEQAARAGSEPVQLDLASGAVVIARCDEIRVGSTLAGALLEFSVETVRRPSSRAEPLPATGPDDVLLAEVIQKATGRFTVIGESGSGKLTRARELHQALRPHEPLTIQSSGLAMVDGATPWLQALKARMADPRGAVVIRNVEVLDDRLCQSLMDLLALPRDAEPLIIMTRSTDRGVERAGLQQQMGRGILEVAPLRQRRDELADLAYEILRESGSAARVGSRAMAAIVNYSWPGNFPQLRQTLEEAGRLAGMAPVGLEHLSEEVRESRRGRRKLSRIESVERQAISDALREYGGNRVQVATALGMSRSTLYRRLRQYDLDTSLTVI